MTDTPAAPVNTAGHVEAPPVVEDGPLRRYLFLIIAMVLFVELNAMAIQMAVPALRSMATVFPVGGLAWTLTIVSLVGAMLQPLGGKLADRLGLRKVILAVAVVFAVGSLLCAVTDSFALFLAGRALQAVVLVMPAVAYRVYRDSLPPRHVPVALGTLGTGIGLAALVGPIVAGALIDAMGYRALWWFFFVYVVIVAPLVYFSVPKRPAHAVRTATRIDFAGGATLALGVGALLLGLSEGASWGWTSAAVLGCVLAGLLLLGAFFLIEGRVAEPMIDLSLLRTPAVTLTLLVGFFGIMPMIGFGFALPQMLQTPVTPGLAYAFGLGALAVGLIQIPYGLAGMIFGPVGGAITRRVSIRTVMVAGLAFMSVGVLLLGLFHTDLVAIVAFTGVVGIGMGLFYAAGPNLMVEAVPPSQTGVSGGIQICVLAIGASVGSALIGTILAQDVVAMGPAGPVFGEGAFTAIFFVTAAAGALGIVVTLLMRHGRKPSTGGVASSPVEAGH